MSRSRRGRDSLGGSPRPRFEGEQPRLRFDDVVDGEVSGSLPVDMLRRDEGAEPRPAAAVWREVDVGTGAPLFACPDCWRELAPRGRSGVEVRVLDERPDWARCAVCDPERVC